MPKGFASLSKFKRKEMGKKGGTASQFKGAGHAYNSITAKAAAMKGVATRKRRAVQNAAIYLLECGFSAADLAKLDLTQDEYIYFGGSESTKDRVFELKERLDGLKTTENSGSTAS